MTNEGDRMKDTIVLAWFLVLTLCIIVLFFRTSDLLGLIVGNAENIKGMVEMMKYLTS